MYPIQNSRQLGAYLKALRRSRHLTQADLGKLLGVSAARVGKIDRQPGAVSTDRLLKLLGLLGARIGLVDRGGADEPTNQQAGLGESRSDQQRTALTAGEW